MALPCEPIKIGLLSRFLNKLLKEGCAEKLFQADFQMPALEKIAEE